MIELRIGGRNKPPAFSVRRLEADAVHSGVLHAYWNDFVIAVKMEDRLYCDLRAFGPRLVPGLGL